MRIFLDISPEGSSKNIHELTRSLLSYAGKWVQVEIKPLSCAPDQLVQERQRTLDQNNYYWGVVIPAISQFTGYTPDETHEALKQKFLTKITRLRWDKRKKLKLTRSTTELATKDFSAFILNIRNYFATERDGQRYSIAGAPNQSPSITEEGQELFLIDPVELSQLSK